MPAKEASELIERIKGNPSRRLVVRPSIFAERRLPTLRKAWEFVESVRVSIIGWDLPHVSPHEGNRGQDDDFIWSKTDFESILEYWELHRSGQFALLTNFHESGPEHQHGLHSVAQGNGLILSAIGHIYDFTEVFEFVARYASKMQLNDGVDVAIDHLNMDGVRLGTGPGYYPIYTKPNIEKRFSLERHLSFEDAVLRNRPVAAAATEEFFEYFAASIRPDLIRKHQEDYYSYRIGDDPLEGRHSAWPEEGE